MTLKTRRHGLRPITQTGFPHLPRNPRSRNFGEGGSKVPGVVLNAFNEAQDGRQLHPTKGWRVLNVKRSRAALIVANILDGQTGWSTGRMKRFLVEGY